MSEPELPAFPELQLPPPEPHELIAVHDCGTWALVGAITRVLFEKRILSTEDYSRVHGLILKNARSYHDRGEIQRVRSIEEAADAVAELAQEHGVDIPLIHPEDQPET